jgi:hypothetical protein
VADTRQAAGSAASGERVEAIHLSQPHGRGEVVAEERGQAALGREEFLDGFAGRRRSGGQREAVAERAPVLGDETRAGRSYTRPFGPACV